MPVLDVRHLRVRLERPPQQGPPLQVIDEVNLRLEEGETLGLVGESGSGKSLTALALMGLLPQGSVVETGQILFEGRDMLLLAEEELRRLRGNRLALIFQDPLSALNPLLSVGVQLAEVLEIHQGLARREALRQAARALGEVGIAMPERRLLAYPHELSGGMRQRVLIAMAVLCKPKLLIADEPTTALDVSVQAQILELLADLQARHGMAILLITHDLGVVARSCKRVHVMYAGRRVETAGVDELFQTPLHPYTLGLLQCLPSSNPTAGARLRSIRGAPPDLAELPSGCAFHPRCGFVGERCRRERPELFLWRAADAQAQHAARLFFVGGRRSACFELERVAQESAAQLPPSEPPFDWRVPGGRR